MANQVLLATMWYITSCWIFSSSCISQLQRLIRNFLWSGREGHPVRARVAWSVITLPLAQGGLGLIDPAEQSRAFLGKLVVRGFLPGAEPWKELLLQRLHRAAPPTGGQWPAETRWIFEDMRRSGVGKGWADRFAGGILRAWERLRPGLRRHPPTCPEERARQPLIWSALVRSEQGHMLGARPRLAWGQFAAGPARSFGDWQAFCRLPAEIQELRIGGMRGGTEMRLQLQATIPEEWLSPFPVHPPPSWMGAFTQLEVLVAARGCCQDGRCLFFELGAEGRLLRVSEEAPLVSACIFQRIRVIAAVGRRWVVDPDPELFGREWRLWAYGARPLARLQWDPGEWFWHDPLRESGSPDLPFFQYTVRLGRRMLLARRQAIPAAAEHWQRQGLTADFLTDFWARLWSSRQPRRISAFQWLVAHRGTAVGTWLAFGGLPAACPRCGHPTESQRHCLWDCPHAQQVWLRVLRLLAALSIEGPFTWGGAAWSTLSGPALQYETSADSPSYSARVGQVRRLQAPPGRSGRWTGQRDRAWELISSLTLWFTWRARCTRVFEGRQEPPAETVRAMWLELIHTLRGQYDQLRSERRRRAFFVTWREGLFYHRSSAAIRWHYRPRVWLFPPPIV